MNTERNTKATVYVDFDGVLAPFDTSKSIEEVAKPGYTLGLPPIRSMCRAVMELSRQYETRVLSAVLHKQAADDKRVWLESFLSREFAENALFVPCGTAKSTVLDNTDGYAYLIDDFSYNLREWTGTGIKVYNGINGTKGTWTGYSIHSKCDWKTIYNQLCGIIMMDMAA